MDGRRPPELHLLLNYPADGAHALAGYLPPGVRERVKVVAPDNAAAQALREQGVNASALSDYAPIDSPEEVGAYDYAYAFTQRLADKFAGVTYRSVPVLPAIDSRVMSDLVFLKIAEAALAHVAQEPHEHVIFAMSYYNYGYLALLDYAVSQGFAVTTPYALTMRDYEVAPLMEPVLEARIQKALRMVAGGEKIARYAPVRRALLAAARAYPAVRELRRTAVGLRDRLGGRQPFDLRRLQATRRIESVFYLLTNNYDLYLKPVYPLIEEFRRHGTDFLVLTHDRNVVANLQPHGVEAIYLPDVLPSPFAPPARARKRYDRVLAAFFERLDAVLAEQGEASLWPAGERPVEYFLLEYLRNDWFYERFYDALQLVDFFHNLADTLQPRSFLIMPDCCYPSDVIVSVAQQRGMATVATFAASVGREFRSIGAYRADILAAYGHECVENLVGAGYAPERCVLTGMASLDMIANASLERDREYVAGILPLDFQKRVVLVATSRADPNEVVWIRRLAEIAAARGDLQVVVKIHPLWSVADYETVTARTADVPCHVVRDIDLHPLLHVADVVVTDYSHAGKEALMFGKPLLTVNLTGTPFRANRYDEDGVALGVYSLDELDAAVERVLDDVEARETLARRRQEVVDRYNYRNDGRAAERLYDLLVNPPPARPLAGDVSGAEAVPPVGTLVGGVA